MKKSTYDSVSKNNYKNRDGGGECERRRKGMYKEV